MKKKKGCTIEIVCVTIIVFLLWYIGEGGSCSVDSKINYCSGQELLAYNYAIDKVKAQLVSPSSAIFPSSIEKYEHTKNRSSECSYTINSWVESKNRLEVMIRTNFRCTIKFDSNADTVSCIGLTIDE